MRQFVSAAALAFLACSPLAAQQLGKPDSDFVDTTSKKAWHAVVERTERGHLIGNPDAEAELILFVSYACEGCYDFAFRGDPELDYALLAPGLMSVEIRHRFNHPVDEPLALLSRCGAPEKFKVNHSMFMRDQKRWRERWDSASAYSRSMWGRDNRSARTSLVNALGFEDLMARRRGYSRMDLLRCLGDYSALTKLRAAAQADDTQYGLPTGDGAYAVPQFVLDGKYLEGVNSWDDLYELLANQFKPKPEEDTSLSGP